MQPYKKLSVWRKAHALALRIHATLALRAGDHPPALANQLRRTAQAIAAHIALGSGASRSAQFAAALDAAVRCSQALDYHLLLARDLALLSSSDHATLEARNEQVARMLVALRRTLSPRPPLSPPPSSRPRGVRGDRVAIEMRMPARTTRVNAERVLRQKPGSEHE